MKIFKYYSYVKTEEANNEIFHSKDIFNIDYNF